MEPNLFISLPSELICSLLVDWLEIKEVALVDSALCNRTHRCLLLDVVYPLCVFHAEPTTEHEEAAMLWINKRRLRADFLIIHDSAVDTVECRQFLEVSRQFVKHVVVRSEMESNVTELLQILNACDNMDSLYIRSCQLKCSEEELKQSGLTLSRLQSVSVYCETSSSIGTTIAISAIRAASNTIKRVQLIDGAEPVLRRLLDIKTFGSLMTLSFFSSNGLFDANLITLLRKTPHLMHLSLRLCLNLRDESGLFLAEHVTNLKTLDISWSYFSNATMMALATHRADTLHALSISRSDYIDATGLRAVLESCKKLRVLYAGAHVIPWALSYDMPLLLNLTTLILNVNGSENHISKLPYFCNSLQCICMVSNIYNLVVDFALYTAQNMPYLRTIHINSTLPYGVNMYPSLDALRIVRPTLNISIHRTHDYFNVMKMPL